VSPKSASAAHRPGPVGSGPGGRITPEDIKVKAAELAGGAEAQVRAKLPLLTYVAIAGGAAVVVAVFLLGRRSGRRRSTIVEIRRG
jgi:hypothetical protein